ncbi:MAG: GNAT family N-acetyltransferase [Acidimicrobiia bacterium]|nr:GNAT family N-acetyltransferase [Acidimicrobiia bacterium]
MSLRPDALPAPVLEIVDSFDGFGDEWDEVVASSTHASVFVTRAWLSAWQETLGTGHRLLIVTARHPLDGRLLAAAPFAVERRRRLGIRHDALVFAGSGIAAPDHLDVITRVGHEDLAHHLWRTVRRAGGWDLADLDGLRAGSLLARAALRRSGDERHVVDVEPCPYASLPASWEEYEADLGKNLRQNLRRYARKMDRESGAPVTERMVTNPDEIGPTVARLAELHQAVRTAKGDAGSFHTPEFLDFATLAARRLFDAGRLRLHRLDVGDEAVAVIWCMRRGDRVAFYSTGYDHAWSKYGPGRRVMAAAIRSAIDEGAKEFDFLRGDESYKDAWTSRSRLNQRLIVPRSRRGRALWALRSIRRALGRR